MKTTEEILPYVRLRFNIENPTFEECYIDGFESSKQSIDVSENPFKLSSPEYEQWSQGWWDHFYGQEPLFEYNNIENSNLETLFETQASNDDTFYGQLNKKGLHLTHSRMTLVAKVAAMVAASFLSYQVIDLIA